MKNEEKSVDKRKKLSKGAKKKEVMKLLDEGYSYAEIRKKIVVSNDTIQRINEDLKRKKEKEQQSLELKIKKEEEIAKAVVVFNENKEEITGAINKVNGLNEQVEDLQQLTEKIQNLVGKNMIKEEEFKGKLYDLLSKELPSLEGEDLTKLIGAVVYGWKK